MMKNVLPSLRFEKLWLGVGLSLVLAVIALSLMSLPPSTPSINYGDKIGHVLAYFVLMGWFAQIYHAPQSRFFYMIGFLLLGGLLEILQGLSGARYAEWSDMLANSIGVLLAWQLTKNRFAYVFVSVEQKLKGS